MKYRALVALPFVAVAAFAAAFVAAGDGTRTVVVRVDIELAKIVAFVGCAAAAARFVRGDYLRRAWALNAICYALILANDLVLGASTGLARHAAWAPLARGIVILVANGCQLMGTVMLARVWRVAGFELAGSPLVRAAVRIGAIAVALVAGGWLTLTSLREVAHGDSGALVDLASTAADIVSFALIAPFLLTAIAFRGGSLGWTWGLYTASLLGWLGFDASVSYLPFVTSTATTTLVSESCRLAACTFALSSGLAQRLAVGAAPARPATPIEQHAA